MKVYVQSGDITQVDADALITATNSAGVKHSPREWFGAMDYAINRATGCIFHDQLLQAPPLIDGQTVVARGNGKHKAAFKNVVFVVDDLRRPLRHVVRAGLKAASDAGFKSVTLPTIRMGVLGAVERTKAEAVRETAVGVREFLADNPDTSIQSATFAVHLDPEVARFLSQAFETPRAS